MDNCLILTGTLSRAPRYRTSPGGIDHCQFWLAHRSAQVEAGLNRVAQCFIAVVASGGQFKKELLPLKMGCTVRVNGFLQTQRARNGESKLVLHAQHIELLS
ncbi:primosomal replication protein N [Celerinatantimonas yamalensis]|uniref:Replication restart protein PriB n=1 Tax=Celerinatantimonas yamalensis TaxID=559956 RepID=A0ABW9G6B2_9GAMM